MKKKVNKISCGVLLIFIFTVVSSVGGEILTLDEALILTLHSNSDLKAKELEITSRQATVKQASVFPNPEVELELEDFGRAEAALFFSQLVELGGKRARRIGLEKTEEEIARLQFEVARLEILSETATRFIELWEAQEKKKYWLEAADIADNVLSIINHRVREGASPEVERIRAEVELANTRLKAKAIEKNFKITKAKLTAVWEGKTPAFEHVAFPSAERENAIDTNLLFQKVATSPQILLWNGLIKRQKAELKLAIADRYSDIELAAGVKREMETKENMAVLGLSIGLPILNRNQGGIRRAELGREISKYEKKAFEKELHATLQELAANYISHREELEAINNDILPNMKKAFEEVKNLYQHGKTSFLDLLDIQHALVELKMSTTESTAQLHISRVQIESLLGIAFKDILKEGK